MENTIPHSDITAFTATILTAEQQAWLLAKAQKYGLSTALEINSQLAEACMDRGMKLEDAISELIDCHEFQSDAENALLAELQQEYAHPECAFGLTLTMELENKFPSIFG